MDNVIELEKERLKRKHKHGLNLPPKSRKKGNPTKNQIITHVLIAMIFVLMSAIYIYWSDKNKEMYKKWVFETSLSFTKIHEWYEKEFGSVLPIDLNSVTTPVIKNETNDAKRSQYLNGVAIEVSKDSVVSALNSGIVVFIGEKEDYGNVVIVQGIDGVDIWYGNITNVNLSLYDYVEKNSLLGSALDNHIYIVIQKDNQYLDYEEYKSQI